jgi:putative endonuclease
LYIGSTNSLEKRLSQHNEGLVVSTKSRLPFILESFIAISSEKQARALEQYLKPGSGHVFIYKRLLGN